MTKKMFPPVHPGEILNEEFLKPLGITAYKLSKEIKVPPIAISQILHGKRGITADMAIKLGQYFCVSAESWVNVQAHYELESAREQKKNQNLGIKPVARAA
jgi:addiction module HigA family antidote